MSPRKKYKDIRQRNCEKEAKQIVVDWFIKNDIYVDFKTIRIVWFAYTAQGYRCMITSYMQSTRFFEISKNVKTGEMICSCYKLYECLIHPSNSPIIEMHDTPKTFASFA